MSRFASGRHSIAVCDICGFQYKLKDLRKLVVKAKTVNILACPECWNPDHPQLMLGTFPVVDPIAVRNPRRDNSYRQSGITWTGTDGEGSRIIAWGWAPVGGPRAYDVALTQNPLAATVAVGTVTVEVS